MSRAERKFTPLEAVNGTTVHVPIWKRGETLSQEESHHYRTTEIDLQVDLPPFVDQRKIGFDLTAISRRSYIGGISKLTVLGEEGKITRAIPQTVKRNPDGSAIAGGRTTIEKIPTSTSTNDVFQLSNPNTQWGDVTIQMNLSEMADRNSSNVRSVDSWSREINAALQRELAKRGNVNLLGGSVGLLERMSLLALFEMPIGMSSYVTGHMELLAPSVLIANLGVQCANKIVANNKEPDHDFRWSLIAGSQIDRMIPVTAFYAKDKILQTRSLVRPLAA